MNLTAYELSLIAGGFGIVGTLIGACSSYYFSTRLMNRQEFNRLASNFHIALINQSRIIKRSSFIKVSTDDLDIAFTNTETALLAFIPLLCESQRKSINAIWDNYNNGNKTHKDMVKFHAYDILNSVDKNKLKENLLVNIETLIEFVKIK